MGAFSVEVATMVVDAAVIQRAEAHEAMLQGVVPLLVHVVVPDYILLTGKPLQKGRGGGATGWCLFKPVTESATSHFISVEAAAATCRSQLAVGECCAHCNEEGQDVFKDDGFCGLLIYFAYLKVVAYPNAAPKALGLSEHRRSFHMEHEVCSPYTHCLYIMFSLPPKCFFFFN